MSMQVHNLSERTFDKWKVTGGHRRVPSGPSKQIQTQWLCTCVCGTERWVAAAHLVGDATHHCGGPAHRGEYVVGDEVGSFTILSFEKRMKLRCRCGRVRTFAKETISQIEQKRLTCGCDGIDWVYLRGDPNLPPGVRGYKDLCGWAGISPQAITQFTHREGLRHAILRLAAKAEENHPGEGWRVLKVVPYPAEGAPAKVRQPNGRKTLARVLPIIREIQASGILSLEEITQELNHRLVPAPRGGEWHSSSVYVQLQQASRDLVAESQARRAKRDTADRELEETLLRAAPQEIVTK